MCEVVCSNPRIILNPKAPELILKYKHWILNGVETKKRHYTIHPKDFDYRYFSPRRNHISKDNYQDNVIIDDETGQLFFMYLSVPCGHCDICKVSKMQSFVKRCQYESQLYDFFPWFCTLTYDEQHVPVDGVCVRDCQLFLKRFRINLKRAGFNFSPRYVLVSEYGSKTHRPHYHAIFWNINSRTHDDFLAIKDILAKSWSNGFIQSRLVRLDDPKDKGFFYTCKYLKKDCVVPDGKNDTFVLSSKGHGGIGSGFIDKHISKIRKSLNVNYMFRDKWTGKCETIMWSQYVLNRVFPSFCRSCDRKFRIAVHDFIYFTSHHIRHGASIFLGHEITDLYFKLFDSDLSKYMYLPRDFEHEFNRHGTIDFSFINSFVEPIKLGLARINFELCHSVALLRQRFLGRLFLYNSMIDISFKSRKCANILSWKSDRTIAV